MGVLPGILDDVEHLMGRETALTLALRLGGVRIYVPTVKNMRPDHELIFALGDRAGEFADHFSGEDISIPFARAELIIYLADQAVKTKEIAARLGVTIRTVQRHLKRRSDSIRRHLSPDNDDSISL